MPWNILISVVRIALGVYVGLSLLLFFRQSGYVYFPDRIVSMTPADLGMSYEQLKLTTADGETLSAWYVPALDSSPALLFCHGNAGDIGDRVYSIKAFHDMGLSVLIFDYRGYGDSTGKPTENGTYQDALAGWHWLTEGKGLAKDKVVVFGESLGASVAGWLAAQVHPGVLAVESGFISAQYMARRMFPYLPVRWLCRFRYDTLAAVAGAKCAVVVSHSPNDEMVPFECGQRLLQAAPEPKIMIEPPGGHNDGGLVADARSLAAFKEFVLRHLARE